MPQDQHNEWPSFETVLRDVATSDPAQLAEPEPLVAEPSQTGPTNGGSLATMDRAVSTPAPVASAGASDIIDLLPAPLPPLEIDTSAVRELLMPKAENPAPTFALEALEPLEPPTSLDETPAALEPLEPPTSLDETLETFESLESFDDEPPSVFDLAFDADQYAPIDQDELVLESDSLANDAVLDEPASEAVFELDDESLAASEQLPTYDELVTSAGDADAGFTLPTIDLFDLQIPDDEFDSVATANAIEGDLNEIHDLMPDFSLDEAEEDGSGNNESESDNFDLDNVVALHPNGIDDADSDPGVDWLNGDARTESTGSLPGSESVNDAPPATRVSHTGWVGLEAVPEPAPPVVEEIPDDPWAHMRPEDETQNEGFWAKIFGGEERKRAKAKRRKEQTGSADTTAETVDSPAISYDSKCPNCGGESQVDLDDPIGRRVHVSCPECDHMWFTPYIEAQTG